MRKKISKRSVDALKPGTTGDKFIWDVELKGFGFRRLPKPSGAGAFVIAYYAPGLYRVKRRITLGAYPPLAPEAAREQAMQLLAAVERGEDPAKADADERRAARDETVTVLFPKYVDDGIGRRKPRTVEYYESLGKLYIVPRLGTVPVRQLTPRIVADLHRDLRDKPVTANRVARLVRSFWFWCAKQGYVSGTNPARGVDWFPEHARERYLTVEEMARLGQALRVAETIGLPPAPEHTPKSKPTPKRKRNAGMFASELKKANPVAVAALRFLMFSGWRETEALTLQWSDVDLSTGVVTLGNTKSGKSIRTLSAPALELVNSQKRVKDCPYVFVGRDGKKPLRELQRLWYAARSEARLENLRLHDLRHSVASFAGGRGYSLFLIGKLLGHKDQRSTARYAHLSDDIRKTMADDVGQVIRDAMAQIPKRESATWNAEQGTPVTPLRAAR